MHPGKGAQVLHHRSLTVYPHNMAATGDGDLSADDEPNPPLRVPNRPSTDNHIATLERGRMPCTSLPVKRGEDLWIPVTVDLDSVAQLPVITCSTYVKLFPQTQLDRHHHTGMKVYTTWITKDGVRMVCTSMGTVTLELELTDDPHTPVRIAVAFEILEDRNDRDLDMIEMSIPSSVYENFPAELRTVQRSNLASRAFWQTPAATVWHRVPDSRAYSPRHPTSKTTARRQTLAGPRQRGDRRPRPSEREWRRTPACAPCMVHSGEPIYGVTTHNTERVVVYGSGQDTTPRRAEHVTASPIAPVANGAAAAAGTAPDSPDQQSVDRWRSLGVSLHLSRHIARTQDRVHIPAVQPSAATELVAPFKPQRLPPDTRDGSEASAMPTLGPVVRGAPAANDW